MRVAIVAESFLPNVNGVTNSVLRILEYLRDNGHDALVIAPGARDFEEEIPEYAGFPIVRVPTIMVPMINSLPIGVPMPAVINALRSFHPDVIHLASPFVLGGAGASAAKQLDIPCVGVYQTDVAGFAQKYNLAPLIAMSWEWTKAIHNKCQLTLAPSSATISTLRSHGIRNVHQWARGVDAQRFNPSKRSQQLRTQWNPTGAQTIVGYVGRLAAEKGVERLAQVDAQPDMQLVIVGDGPERPTLEALMPNAVFTGALDGEELAQAYASFDIFCHTGAFETFCQTIQEALASGIPAIGPNAGGPIDLIRPGSHGALLDVDTYQDTVVNTIRQLRAPNSYPTLCQNARDSIEGKTWEALCEQLLDYYQQAMSATSPRWRRTIAAPIQRVRRAVALRPWQKQR